MPFTNLQDAIASRSAADKKKIYARLGTLHATDGFCQQAVQNFNIEMRLPSEKWDKFFDAILSTPTTGPATKLQENICRSFTKSTLSGPVIGFDRSTHFGKIIDYDQFVEIFRLTRKIKWSTAERRIRNTLDKASLSVARIRHYWKNIDVGCHIVWSTFDEVGELNPPFLLSGDLNHVKCALGLSGTEIPHDSLVLQYELPPGVDAKFPTIADAYAAPEWAYYFRPAPPNSSSGRTLPRADCADHPGRPECVHQMITCAHLTAIPQRIY